MRRALLILVILALAPAAGIDAQRRTTRKPVTKPAVQKPVPLKTERAIVKCPEPLGTGMKTGVDYCFVPAGNDAAQGVLVSIPARTGDATLIFDLHNRHVYSEERVKEGRGFAKYMAGIGVLTMKMEILRRAAVVSEFRTAADLYERIGGGAGPSGAKAIAPIGVERVYVTIPPGIDQVSLLGEVLEAHTAAGVERTTPGRPVAIVSNIQVEFRPAPAPAPKKR